MNLLKWIMEWICRNRFCGVCVFLITFLSHVELWEHVHSNFWMVMLTESNPVVVFISLGIASQDLAIWWLLALACCVWFPGTSTAACGTLGRWEAPDDHCVLEKSRHWSTVLNFWVLWFERKVLWRKHGGGPGRMLRSTRVAIWGWQSVALSHDYKLRTVYHTTTFHPSIVLWRPLFCPQPEQWERSQAETVVC